MERVREAIAALVTQAHQQDESDAAALGSRRGDARPAALARRADRVARREAALRRVEAQAKAEAADACQRRADAAAERQQTGKTRRGNAPHPVEERPDDKAQSHCTAPALPSMRTTTTGWESGGKAPARVEGACQILVAWDVSDAAHATPQAEPMAQAILAPRAQAGMERPKDASGTLHALPAPLDHGSDREAAVQALET